MIDKLSALRRQAQTGSCSTFVQAFIEQQQAQGYANKSMKLSSRLVNDYAAWLDQRGIDGDSLAEAHAADYLNERCSRCTTPGCRSPTMPPNANCATT